MRVALILDTSGSFKKKLKPKYNTPPTAMMSKEGKLVTSNEEIKSATMEHYQEVLRNRPMKPHLQKSSEY